MTATPLIALYVIIGLGCAVTLFATRRHEAQLVDGLLLFTLWPLFGPFVLTRGEESPGGSSPRMGPAHGLDPEDPDDLLDALRRAGGGPLAALLPDVDAGRQLARRLQVAREHVAEIDRLFQLEQYSEEAALARQRELRDRGDDRSASMIDNRLQIIRRLRRMRERFNQEIQQIRETLTQLQIQAELVRIAGTADRDTRDMVEDLVQRIQGLEDVMTEEEALSLSDPYGSNP
ncbi:MAG: hypothetical protein CMH57_09820 [Myxococcales bacterium]|nr:hypothetical protein [Myxococcales bacterium]